MTNKAKKNAGTKSKSSKPTKGTLQDLNSTKADRVKGGLKPPPPPPKKGCWVARAVYGENNPRWLLFRDWLFEEAPFWLRHLYLRYGEGFARLIMPHPFIKSLIRWSMDLVIERKRKSVVVA
jgi:hypothetical protein